MKSLVSDLTTVCGCVIFDAFAKCATDKHQPTRDLITIKKRVKHEGISFLTISLPNFGKAFELCLDKGLVKSDDFPGFRYRRSLPAFLQGLITLVFDAETGGLLEHPDTAAIEGIRQIAYSFKKLSLPCTPERESMALRGFEEVECFLSEQTVLPRDSDLFNQIADLLWVDILNGSYDSTKLYPKHGPGQTAERVFGNRKYTHRTWYERLESFFPSDINLMSCYSQLDDVSDGINCVQFVSEEDELPVRITCVPKTLKGPRIIAIEPVCMQYAQQALSREIIHGIEASQFTGGHVNFNDQSVNQRLAIKASSDQFLATLDMSEASDRVPLSVVTTMLRAVPDYRDAILACRSKVAQMPDGKLIPLSKFASMGSALCFPIESMYFFCVILTARFRKHNLPVTPRNLKKLIRGVYVYGDDIVVPVDEVDIVCETLTMFYCKVNAAKSFWNGKFRESCGMDAYDGECVTPTYLRTVRPTNKGAAKELISWTATSNLFYQRGYWRTAALLKQHVEAVLGELPIVKETSPGLGWISFQRKVSSHRYSAKLHRFEIRTYVVKPGYQKDPLSGWSALLKFFLNAQYRLNGDISVDKEHLSRSPRSGTATLKRRWTTPF